MPGRAEERPHIVIAGAGSIGCFVGGLLAAAGGRVTLLARPATCATIATHGLTLTDYAGLDTRLDPDQIGLSDDPACLASADLVLVTVKTGATGEMADLIFARIGADVPVISLQNGLDAIDMLGERLPDHDLRAGMVPFNVVPRGPGCYHRAISGDILIGSGPVDLTPLLSLAELPVSETPDIRAVQWGKLLMNLNNAPNALSGLTIAAQLMDRDWRQLMADQMAEALAVLRASRREVRSTTPVPPGWVPHILRLPNGLFRRIAARMLTVDPTARTSMAYDLEAGRRTEIDALQGRIIAMGRDCGQPTPICTHIAGLIARAEARDPADGPLPPLTPNDLRP